MAVSVDCFGCGTRLKVADPIPGKSVRCPRCKGIVKVPENDDPLDLAAEIETPPSPEREDNSESIEKAPPRRQLRKFCVLDEPGKALLRTAMESLGLSARAHDRILRMARTIADLDGTENIQERHVSEAIGYRSLDRKLWKR